MRSILVILALCSLLPATGQWNGTYNGVVNGDPVRMTLSQNGDAVTGQLRDSYQTYDITGSISGDHLEGAATESTTRLQFGLQAKLESETLSGKLVLEAEGAMAEVPFVLTRQGASSDPATGASLPFPPDAQHPTELCGGWTQNESYNSGSGDAFMGANFSQSMAFLPGGRLADGGSRASMSGPDYYGQSSGSGSGLLEGVGWYALGNQFYLLVFHHGSWQPVHLGRWYVEGNNLLITGANNQKLLLSRS